jgi:hypothetical protein
MTDWFFRVQVQIHAQKFNDHKSDPKLLNHYLLLIFIGKILFLLDR